MNETSFQFEKEKNLLSNKTPIALPEDYDKKRHK
jgi:hypothetical protein